MIRTLAVAVLILIALTSLASAKEGDTIDASDYFILGDSTLSWRYVIDSLTFTDRFLGSERTVSGRSYKVRVRTYSSGATDTTLYRRSEIGIHHVVPSSGILAESLTLPRYVYAGQRWFERDSSWSYTVLTTSGTIVTPEEETFRGVIAVRASSRMNGVAGALPNYDLYFAPNEGLVAVGVGRKTVLYLSKKS